MKLLISACLLGVKCRYDGCAKPNPAVLALAKEHTLIPVCPEQLGGLATPRPPAERTGSRVVTEAGTDVTRQYQRGAEQTLLLAQLTGCRYAILKAKAPPVARARSMTVALPAPFARGTVLPRSCFRRSRLLF